MKIGEAGEAFFVFETDEDVPDSLVTSPVLTATQPGESDSDHIHPSAGRFGSKQEQSPSAESTHPEDSQEPDFLDLNVSSSADALNPLPEQRESKLPPEDENSNQPGLLARVAEVGKTVVGATHELEKSSKDKLKDETFKEAFKEVEQEQKDYVKDSLTAVQNFSPSSYLGGYESDKGDEALPNGHNQVEPPTVRYTDGRFHVLCCISCLTLRLDIVYDMEGYHSHSRGRSDNTVREGTSRSNSSDGTESADRTPGPSRRSPL